MPSKAASKRKKAGKKTARKRARRAPPTKGRPRIEFDLIEVSALGKIRAPYEIMARKLGCSVDTIRERLREGGPQFDEDFSQAYHTGAAERNIGLRTKQYNVAIGGNIQMLLHLAKHELGQTKPLELPLDNPPETERSEDAINYDAMSTADLKQWERLLAKVPTTRSNHE